MIHFIKRCRTWQFWITKDVYSGDLNCKLVWYSDDGDLFALQILWYSDSQYHGSLVFRSPFENRSALPMFQLFRCSLFWSLLYNIVITSTSLVYFWSSLVIFFLDEVVRLKEETDAAPSTEAFNATGINTINFGITIQPVSQDSEDMIGKELVNLIDHS